jgi:hypothetical protein
MAVTAGIYAIKKEADSQIEKESVPIMFVRCQSFELLLSSGPGAVKPGEAHFGVGKHVRGYEYQVLLINFGFRIKKSSPG